MIFSKSDRKQPVKSFDLVNLQSLKDKIEQQKVAKSTKKKITTPVVRVEPTSHLLKSSTSTPLVRYNYKKSDNNSFEGSKSRSAGCTRHLSRFYNEPKWPCDA